MKPTKTQDKIITIETGNLMDFMRPGILGLIDYSNGRAYLSDAVCLSENLMRQLLLIHKNQHALQKEEALGFTPVVVSFVENTEHLKYAYADSLNELASQGFKILSRPIQYKVKAVVGEDFRSIGQKYLCYVYLCTQAYPTKLLGVFGDGRQAQEFMHAYYPGKRIQGTNVVVSDNELTKLYFSLYKDELYNKLMGLT